VALVALVVGRVVGLVVVELVVAELVVVELVVELVVVERALCTVVEQVLESGQKHPSSQEWR
jgi:hypothetical protein